MQFGPDNMIVKLCLQAMVLEEQSNQEEANRLFFQAWNQAGSDFEKFIAAYHLSRQQKNASDTLHWLKISLQLALKIDDDTVKAAFPLLYSKLAECYLDLGDPSNSKKYDELAASVNNTPSDKGPFYHGTKAALQLDDLLTPGNLSNYKSELTMNHIYFTALMNGAGLAASLAKGDGQPRIYIVEPTGNFENDPNLTNKKFPGNPTRSYRTLSPLKITGEIKDWEKLAPGELEKWQEKLKNNKGDIIN